MFVVFSSKKVVFVSFRVINVSISNIKIISCSVCSLWQNKQKKNFLSTDISTVDRSCLTMFYPIFRDIRVFLAKSD